MFRPRITDTTFNVLLFKAFAKCLTVYKAEEPRPYRRVHLLCGRVLGLIQTKAVRVNISWTVDWITERQTVCLLTSLSSQRSLTGSRAPGQLASSEGHQGSCFGNRHSHSWDGSLVQSSTFEKIFQLLFSFSSLFHFLLFFTYIFLGGILHPSYYFYLTLFLI